METTKIDFSKPIEMANGKPARYLGNSKDLSGFVHVVVYSGDTPGCELIEVYNDEGRPAGRTTLTRIVNSPKRVSIDHYLAVFRDPSTNRVILVANPKGETCSADPRWEFLGIHFLPHTIDIV